jgi:hypothetical protein
VVKPKSASSESVFGPKSPTILAWAVQFFFSLVLCAREYRIISHFVHYFLACELVSAYFCSISLCFFEHFFLSLWDKIRFHFVGATGQFLFVLVCRCVDVDDCVNLLMC